MHAFKKIRFFGATVSCLAVALAVGCGSPDGGPDSDVVGPPDRPDLAATERQFGLLLKVPVSDYSEIAFFEPMPGRVFVIEREYGSPTSASFLNSNDLYGASATTIYAALRPGEQIPRVIEEAQNRVDDSVLDKPPEAMASTDPLEAPPDSAPTDEPKAPELSPQHVTSSGAHFRDDHGGCPVAANTFDDFCWLNRTGNWSESATGERTTHVVANFGSGNFTFKITAGTSSSTETILAGERWTFTGVGPEECKTYCNWWSCETWCHIIDVTLSGQISGATGDSWHWGGEFNTVD